MSAEFKIFSNSRHAQVGYKTYANGVPAIGSPYFTYTRLPFTQLGKPLMVIEGVKLPISVAIKEILVEEVL